MQAETPPLYNTVASITSKSLAKTMLIVRVVEVSLLLLVTLVIHLASTFAHTIKNTSQSMKLTMNSLIHFIQFTNCYIKKKEIVRIIYTQLNQNTPQKSNNSFNNQNLYNLFFGNSFLPSSFTKIPFGLNSFVHPDNDHFYLD